MTYAQQNLRYLESLRTHLAESESAERGYLLNGQPSYLDLRYAASKAISKDLENLKLSAADNPSQLRRLQQLQLLVNQRLGLVHQVTESRADQRPTTAMQMVKISPEKKLADEIRNLTYELQDAESTLLAKTQEEFRTRISDAYVLTCLLAVLCLMVAAGAKISQVRGIAGRHKAEAALQEANEQLSTANEKLKAWVEEVELRARESSLIYQMADLLQGCLNKEDAFRVVKHTCPEIFPHQSGALYLIDSACNQLQLMASWGEGETEEQSFAPNECWALRRGHSYLVRDREAGPVCSHMRHPLVGGYLCIPMHSQAEIIGVLLLECRDSSRTMEEYVNEARRQLAVNVTEHIALALASLELRESLKLQSIRDPLTGLYNRRYMEEFLEQEVQKAKRNQRSLGVIMMDLDHFKKVNDTFGHRAGDTVLKALGNFLKSHTRAGDVVCRYGGEEFTIILPEATLEDTLERAERLRSEISNIQFEHGGQVLGTATLSIGVAGYPRHGGTPEALLQSADEALYCAKTEGRNRVAVCYKEKFETIES